MSHFINKETLIANSTTLRTTLQSDCPPVAPHDVDSDAASKTYLVLLKKTACGTWEVRNETGQRGGLFRDYESAKDFIRREFFFSQPTIIREINEDV